MTYKTPTTFTVSADPGHGWLLVTRADIAALGLSESDFTPYSYCNGDRVALEEDCDAATFIDAYTARHGRAPKYRDRYAATRSSVRSWNRYGTKPSKW
jgi:hypothetical protein